MTTTTTPTVIKGKPIADAILTHCEKRVKRIIEKTGVTPCLATVLVGSDPASEKYVARKGKLCEKYGMKSIKVHMPDTSTTDQVVATVTDLANAQTAHRTLSQPPTPNPTPHPKEVAMSWSLGAALDEDDRLLDIMKKDDPKAYAKHVAHMIATVDVCWRCPMMRECIASDVNEDYLCLPDRQDP